MLLDRDRVLDTSINSEDINEFSKSVEVEPERFKANLDQSLDLHDIDEHSVEDDASLGAN